MKAAASAIYERPSDDDRRSKQAELSHRQWAVDHVHQNDNRESKPHHPESDYRTTKPWRPCATDADDLNPAEPLPRSASSPGNEDDLGYRDRRPAEYERREGPSHGKRIRVVRVSLGHLAGHLQGTDSEGEKEQRESEVEQELVDQTSQGPSPEDVSPRDDGR